MKSYIYKGSIKIVQGDDGHTVIDFPPELFEAMDIERRVAEEGGAVLALRLHLASQELLEEVAQAIKTASDNFAPKKSKLIIL